MGCSEVKFMGLFKTLGSGVGLRVTNRIPGLRILLYVLLGFLMACNTENAPDCLQNSGDIVRKEIMVPDFTKITVFEKVELILIEGNTQKVEVETGAFLFEEIRVDVEEGRLLLRNDNFCNLFREYALTKVYVTSPNITEVRSSTGLSVRSEGVLSYTTFSLISESFINSESETTDGEFDLELDMQKVNLVVNGIAYFQLSGRVENISIVVAAGDSRVEAENLIAQNIIINHRGTNDLLVNPQNSLTGVIRGTGDVLSFNRPNEVDVEALYKGRLIFKE